MSDRSVRLQALHHALKERILILDGGMGTMIQSYKLEGRTTVANASPIGQATSRATTTCWC